MIECDKADGTKCKVGDIIIDPMAWMLCLPGFRNAAARFVAADEATIAKVSEELARRAPIVDETRRYLQKKIDEHAASGKFAIDPVTGFFKRQSDGTFGKISNLIAHVFETAEGHGLKPVVTAPAPAPAPAPAVVPVVAVPVTVQVVEAEAVAAE